MSYLFLVSQTQVPKWTKRAFRAFVQTWETLISYFHSGTNHSDNTLMHKKLTLFSSSCFVKTESELCFKYFVSLLPKESSPSLLQRKLYDYIPGLRHRLAFWSIMYLLKSHKHEYNPNIDIDLHTSQLNSIYFQSQSSDLHP